MYSRSLVVLIAAGVAAGIQPARAQAVGQADVQIQSFSVTASRPVPVRPVAPIRGAGSAIAPPTTVSPGAALQGPSINIQVVVLSNNDDDAQNVRLNIFLPPESHVLAVPAGCQQPPTNNGATGVSNAFVHCAFGAMFVNATRTINLTISRPPSYVVPRVGVFAWSDTPDPNTGNNHAEAVAP